MPNNLRSLGLVLLMVLAMSAVGTETAGADDEGQIVAGQSTGTHESAFISATDTGEENTLEFTIDGEVFHCDVNEFHGEIPNGTTDELTLKTTFGGSNPIQNCQAEGLPATVDNNGCHLRFRTAETSDSNSWRVLTDFHCGEGEGLEINVYGGSAHGFQVCKITILPYTGLEGVTLHNQVSPTHDLTTTVSLSSIQGERSGLCGTEECGVEIHGEVTLAAENIDRELVDLYVEHKE